MATPTTTKLREVSRPDEDPRTAPVVRAIDVGFGLVKLTIPGPGRVDFISFPSMAIPADLSAVRTLSTRRRDTFDVPVNSAKYEVGRDVGLALAGGSFGRDVTDEFYRGAIYEALTKGALRYMAEAGDRIIDQLVLGLPVNQYNDAKRREYLRSTYEGDIDIGDGKTMTVRKVAVQAQPMGGYAALDSHLDELNATIAATGGALKPLARGEDLDELCVLMIDAGEHTLDWLLIQEGTINARASGAASDAGRHRVVRAVMDALAGEVGRPLGPAVAPRVNEALRMKTPVKLSGVNYDLSRYEPVIMSVIEDSINLMVDGLRDAHEIIDLMVLVGGQPERYRDVLARRFPAIPVFIMPESLSANVRGFQMIGEALAAG
ncbi:MAG TPA: ParM/StbA family protein [Burkholderiaceae bacterium]|nr:ParM/StbA family protein [Burkholderiaceae bacterium]